MIHDLLLPHTLGQQLDTFEHLEGNSTPRTRLNAITLHRC